MTDATPLPKTHLPAIPPVESSTIVAWAAMVITLVLSVTAMKLARGLLLPVVLAMLLSLLLSAPVRWLRKRNIPERIGAAIVVFGTLFTVLVAGALLVSPAISWVNSAPVMMRQVEQKVRLLSKPLATLQSSAERMERVTAAPVDESVRQVHVTGPGIISRLAGQTAETLPSVLSVIFLTYFLLAAGPLFRRKLAEFLPVRGELRNVEHLLTAIELSTSRYLATTVAINASVGVVTMLALYAVGVPNAALGGVLAGVANFIPYLGPFITISAITLAALGGVDNTALALLAPALFLIVHLTESNFVTPMLLGRRLPLNTVTIFLGLIFFFWVWGVPGAVLAVPLTAVARIACDHIPSLNRIGALLDT